MELLNPLSLARAKALLVEKYFDAVCLSTDTVGDCVYIRADVDPSGKYRVGKVNPKLGNKIPAIGIVVSKDTATECTVQWVGELYGTISGFIPGKNTYIGLNGKLTQDVTSLEPGVGEKVYIQNMGVALTSDILLLNINMSPSVRTG